LKKIINRIILEQKFTNIQENIKQLYNKLSLKKLGRCSYQNIQAQNTLGDEFVVNVDGDILKNTLLESKLNEDLLRVNSNKAHDYGNELLEIQKVISNVSDSNRLNIHDFNLINSLHIKKLSLIKSLVFTTVHLKVIKSAQIKLLVTLYSFFLG